MADDGGVFQILAVGAVSVISASVSATLAHIYSGRQAKQSGVAAQAKEERDLRRRKGEEILARIHNEMDRQFIFYEAVRDALRISLFPPKTPAPPPAPPPIPNLKSQISTSIQIGIHFPAITDQYRASLDAARSAISAGRILMEIKMSGGSNSQPVQSSFNAAATQYRTAIREVLFALMETTRAASYENQEMIKTLEEEYQTRSQPTSADQDESKGH